MTKREFQEMHGFTDEDMKIIDYALKLFGGKIVAILENKNVDKVVKGDILTTKGG